ncbi:aspartate kinase [Fistulina hepatica ATCC 64428]|uniref:aspartate kinase n=1 Tax=Fistulina hepatica ATCC 64428 TaxID=1128425 RepID=A0A0D7A3U8_9AGAR|nr:aspartate kinase [Fistulina hepatica ATCC 64428]
MSSPVTPDSSRASSLSSISMPTTPPNLHQNSIDPSAKWIVQKFGGTSVGKFPVKIAKEVVSQYLDDNKVAVVCSARSGSIKALGTTSLLLRAASEVLQRRKPQSNDSTPGFMTPLTRGAFGQSSSPPSSPLRRSLSDSNHATYFTPLTAPPSEFHETAELVRREHLKAARESVRHADLLKELEIEIENDCHWLFNFLSAAQFIDEISPRSRDSIVGIGERLACKIMATVLRDNGIDAEYVSLEDIVAMEEHETQQGSLDQAFYDRLSARLGERIRQCAPRVPVVTGFFGPVPGSLLRQVGRGYTDLLSALLAVGVEAAELQIWKEVDGIFTADPRKVPTARLLPFISPDEAAELTYYGSEVVHPFTMEQVIRRSIPIRIKNVDNPRGSGSVIVPDVDDTDVPIPDTPGSLQDLARAIRGKTPTAVTIKEKIVVLNVNSNRKSVSHGFLAGIFGTLDRFGVVVDLISTSEVHVSMAIEDNLAKKLLDRLVRELQKSGSVSVHRDMAILSLVGRQMRNMVGIAGRMFSTLAQGNVNIEMISQGASEINISCVIDGRDAVKALNLIHQSCLTATADSSRNRGPWLF